MANFVNFTPQIPGMSYGGFPPDMQQEAQKLARRQMIADAMLQKGMQPPNTSTQVVSGIAIPNSPLAGIAQMLMPYFAGKMQDRLDTERSDLATRYNNQLGTAVRDYATKTTGGPEVLPEDQAGPTRPFVPADPATKRNAIIEAMASGYGPLREIATQDWKEMLKNQLSMKDLGGFMKDFTPESVQAFVASGGKSPLVRNINARSDGGVTYDTTTGKPIGATATYGELEPIPGTAANGQPPTMGQKNFATGKYNFAPKGSSVSVTNMPENKGNIVQAEGEAKLITGMIGDSFKAAQDAAQDLKLLSRASKAFNEGIKAGTWQEARNVIDRALQTAGFKGDKGNSIANTETFMKTMAQRILQHTKELRPLSDTDRQYLEDILAGKNMSQEGIRRLLEVSTDAGLGLISDHNTRLKNYDSKMPGFKQQMTVPYPIGGPGNEMHIRNPAATPKTQRSVDDEAKALGGVKIQ